MDNELLEEFFVKAEAKKGRICVVEYQRPVKIKKRSEWYGRNIVKYSKYKVRVGINYANQAVVKEKHESGEREKVGLPDHMEKLSSCHYKHKHKGTHYLGLTPNKGPHDKKEVKYYENGKEIAWEDLESHVLASEKNNSSENDWITLDYSRIISLSGVEM